MTKLFCLTITFLTMFSANAVAENLKLDPVLAGIVAQANEQSALEKFDPILLEAYETAVNSNVDLSVVKVEGMAAITNALTEEEVRNIFRSYGVEARSVLVGEITIVTLQGSLKNVIELCKQESILSLEASRIQFPEPSASVGN